MKIKSKILNECRACKSKNLTTVLSLGKSYLSDFVTTSKKPASYPLVLVLCKNCYLLQLKHTAPASELYTEHYGYRSGINQTMRDELKEIAEKNIEKLDSSKKKLLAVDIGANDGTLLKNYPKSVERV